jgi:hypothetical protein
MKRKTGLRDEVSAGLAAIGLALVTGGFTHTAAAQDVPPSDSAHKPIEAKKPEYSPYPDQHFANLVLWGIAHLGCLDPSTTG